MSGISLTSEQIQLKKALIDFSRKELNEDLGNRDHQGLFPTDLWHKCASMDIMALPFPEKYGGCGQDFVTTLIALEALSYACKDSGLIHAICAHLITSLYINNFASDQLKERFLPALCQGKIIASQAITEAEAGSDALSTLTRATRVDDHYVIDGRKMFISNGPVADIVVVLAVTDATKKNLGAHTFFLCETGLRGLTRGQAFEKMGLRTLQNCEIVLDSCAVPLGNIIGKEGQGALIFNEMMEWERILFGACHLGNLKRIIEDCVRYARERKQFGQPIGTYQSISNKIARMKISQELISPLLYLAATKKDEKGRATMEASVIKVFASESLKNACIDAIQIHGAYGYMKEFEIERDLRDSIASTIYSGTAELNMLIIAKLMGL